MLRESAKAANCDPVSQGMCTPRRAGRSLLRGEFRHRVRSRCRPWQGEIPTLVELQPIPARRLLSSWRHVLNVSVKQPSSCRYVRNVSVRRQAVRCRRAGIRCRQSCTRMNSRQNCSNRKASCGLRVFQRLHVLLPVAIRHGVGLARGNTRTVGHEIGRLTSIRGPSKATT